MLSLSLLISLVVGGLLIMLIGGLLVVFLQNRNSGTVTPYSGDLDQDVRDLTVSGRQIEAIRLVRQHMGMNLTQARDYVRALTSNQPPAPAPRDASSLDAQIRDLLAHGNKIGAVKLVRDQTGMGLRESKDYVEHIEGTG
jgi:ribosomal protein L7/L12